MRSSSRLRTLLLAASLTGAASYGLPARAAAGDVVWVRVPPEGVVQLGASVDGAGDVDGDGKEDVLASGNVDDQGTLRGVAFVLSGADGSILRTFRGSYTGIEIGEFIEVHGAGDFDHDDIPDFLLGVSSPSSVAPRGYLAVVSGKAACDGTILTGDCSQTADACVLLRVCGAAHEGFGSGVAIAGDIDGDAVQDILARSAQIGTEAVRLYSGADGSLLWSETATEPEHLGYSLAGLGDITGDGIPDFAVGGSKKNRAILYVYSGADFSIVRKFKGQKPFDYLGSSVANAGLVDGDSVPDMVYSVPGRDGGGLTDAGQIVVVSGRTGKKISNARGTSLRGMMGRNVVPLGDVDGDGAGDVGAGALTGRAGAYSGDCGCGILVYESPDENNLGTKWVAAADVTGDGRKELIVGSYNVTGPGAPNSIFPSGVVRVIKTQ
jgi:hypothetical protein